MRARRFPRATTSSSGLWPTLREVLLLGWTAPDPPEQDDPFRIFELSERDLASAWRQHRAMLMAEAEKRGIAKPWGVRYDAASDEA